MLLFVKHLCNAMIIVNRSYVLKKGNIGWKQCS